MHAATHNADVVQPGQQRHSLENTDNVKISITEINMCLNYMSANAPGHAH